MTLKFRVSLYGRIVYFLKSFLYLLISGGAFGFGIDPGPYNDPGMFPRMVCTLGGGGGILLGISFIGQVFKFRPRFCINDIGIKYNGFYLHVFVKWEEIQSFSAFTVRGGFTCLNLTFYKRKWGICKGITLDLSGLTPRHEKITEEIYRHLVRRNDI